MVLKKILLVYQPPGLGLVYVENDQDIIKHINLTELNENTNIGDLTNKIIQKEMLNMNSHWDTIHNAITKIQGKLREKTKYSSNNQSLVHVLPITNVAINSNGDRCATGSYDRSAKIWDVASGSELQCLEGHKNVVFSVTFNKNGNKILTGSFDGTAKLWDTSSGNCDQTFWGHTSEVVLAQFLPKNEIIVTASTDTTARIFQTETAQELHILTGHAKDIISLQIDQNGKYIVTGSFDKTIRVWDPRDGSCVKVLCGHQAEISSCKINKEGTMLASGSFDGRVFLWDLRQMKYYKIFPGNMSEVLDIDLKGSLIGACNTNGTAYVWDYANETSHVRELHGHRKAITKVCFNPVNDEMMTCSDDRTIRIWNLATTKLTYDTLAHEDAVFIGVYSKCGTKILSGCKDNSCKVWYRY